MIPILTATGFLAAFVGLAILADLAHGALAMWRRRRERRAAEREIQAYAVELRDVLRTSGHPRRQCNAENGLCDAVDRWSRAGGGL